jgi:hypothetical protein
MRTTTLLRTLTLLCLLAWSSAPCDARATKVARTLRPGARFTAAERTRAVRRGLDFIYLTARDPSNFEIYGSDYLWCFYTIGASGSDPALRTAARRMGLERARHWRRTHQRLPEDADALRQAVADGKGIFLFLLIALADHVFTVLLPYDHPQPTEALLRTRTFLQERFGEKFEDQIIEFFVIGGGYARVSGNRIVLSGVHPVFDPTFADFGQPESDRLLCEFLRAKFRLALDSFRAELPDHRCVVQG